MGLSFTIAAGSRQRSHSLVQVLWDSYFTVPNSRLSQPGGSGPCIYISQEQDGPFIPPDTGFPFRFLLLLAGLRWRYSTPPPHGIDLQDIVSLPFVLNLYHVLVSYARCLSDHSLAVLWILYLWSVMRIVANTTQCTTLCYNLCPRAVSLNGLSFS
jgi:hypothetical protein